jgi:hypothetical protein
MKKQTRSIKLIICLGMAAFFITGLVRGSFESASGKDARFLYPEVRTARNNTLHDLDHLQMLSSMPSMVLADLLDYQAETGKSLPTILRDPAWCKKLGFKSKEFRATWYAVNPYQLLPSGLKEAIENKKTPFHTRSEVHAWARTNQFPISWRRALDKALVETTPTNLWRASRGNRPYAHNGEYLEPLVVDHGNGQMEVRDGHIATDPRVIPTNSEVILVLKIQGEDRLIKAKAKDIGGAIKGAHVDLPVQLSRKSQPFPHTRFPKEIRNRVAMVLTKPS